MSFDYKGIKINILDTPGHKDFAEDTFRTLTAVDSVIPVVDSAKGGGRTNPEIIGGMPDESNPCNDLYQ